MRKALVVLTAVMIVLAGCSGGGTGTATESPDADTGGDTTPTGETPMDGGDSGMTKTPMDGGDSGMTKTPMDGGDGDMNSGDGDMNSGDGDMNSGDGDMGSGDGDMGSGGAPAPSSVIGSSSSSTGFFANATQIETTLYNGSQQFDVLIKNDTQAGTQLLKLSRASGGTTTLYQTPEYTALRNTTSGQVQYGAPDGNVGFGVSFASAFILGGSLSYANLVAWDAPQTTTVDGESAFVYEADSLNQTAVEARQSQDQSMSLGASIQQNQVSSVDARMVVTAEGKFKSLNVEMETPRGTIGSNLAIQYGDISISKPSWVDESQAP